MRRFAFLSIVMVLCLGQSCQPPPPAEDDDNNQPGGTLTPEDPNDDGGDDGTGSDGDPGSGDPGNGGGEDPGTGQEDCADVSFDLNGYWLDHGSIDRQVLISHEGSTVFAQFVDEPYVCDHRDGTGATSETSQDLSATLSGCTLTGEITTCRYGCTGDSDPSCTNGITPAAFTGTVDVLGDHIEGTWFNEVDGTEVPVSFDRLSCRRKTPDEYGLPSDLEWSREGDENAGNILYRSYTDIGELLNVNAGVTGTVVAVYPAEGGEPMQIQVDLPNGNKLVYGVYGDESTAFVDVGDAVEPYTLIATLDIETSSGSYALQLTGVVTGTTEFVNPDCIEEPQ